MTTYLTKVWRVGPVGLVGLCLLLGARGASAEVMSWQVNGETREAIVYAPDGSREGDHVPLVLSFHGYGDNMQNFQRTNVHGAWPDAVVVYFQGLETRRGLRGWQVERSDGVNRDLKLVDVALASLRETYNVDDDRIYATGFSNGGMFTYLLWTERPDVFAAYAPVAGSSPSLGSAQTAAAALSCGRGARSGQVSFSDQARRDRGRHRGERRRHDNHRDHELRGRLHGLRSRHTSTPVMTWIHSWRPRLSTRDLRAGRVFFSRSPLVSDRIVTRS